MTVMLSNRYVMLVKPRHAWAIWVLSATDRCSIS